MLQLLWVFITIAVVSCETDNCPIFSAFQNNASLFNKLQGKFFKIVAVSTSPVAPCQQQTFSIGSNGIINEGYFQSPDWCLDLNNCTSTTDYQECDLTPLTPVTPGTLPSPQRNKIKLVLEIATGGDNLCLLYSYCRTSEEGMYVLCRNLPNAAVEHFLEFFAFLPNVTVVNQTNCNFVNSCPP